MNREKEYNDILLGTLSRLCPEHRKMVVQTILFFSRLREFSDHIRRINRTDHATTEYKCLAPEKANHFVSTTVQNNYKLVTFSESTPGIKKDVDRDAPSFNVKNSCTKLKQEQTICDGKNDSKPTWSTDYRNPRDVSMRLIPSDPCSCMVSWFSDEREMWGILLSHSESYWSIVSVRVVD